MNKPSINWKKVKALALENNFSLEQGVYNLIPWNPSKEHWSFIEINNETKEILYFDNLETF